MTKFVSKMPFNLTRLTSSTMAIVNYFCLILLLSGSFVVCLDTPSSSSSSSSSSQSNSGALLQQAEPTKKPENLYEIRPWDTFWQSLNLPVSLENDPDACKPEIKTRTQLCYTNAVAKWNNGGNEKNFCCATQEILDCFFEMVPTYCDTTGKSIYLNPAKQKAIYFSESKDDCGDYHQFWHCSNGIPIVVGATCGALVVIIIVVGGVIFYLKKRKGSSSFRGGDNL
uniref:Uncharacterized protein n=1 Tax=Tetranychus urticae TaxID=32264 RepID=T1JUT3_TETUR